MSEIIKRLEEILTKTKDSDRLLRKELEEWLKELKTDLFLRVMNND